MLNEKDIKILNERGISADQVNSQLNRFKTGFPYLRLAGSATVGNGIIRLDAKGEERAIERWNKYLGDGGDVVKFVPASGAASRMFKALFAFVNGDDDVPAPDSPVGEIISNLDKLPFKSELDRVLLEKTGKNANQLADEKKYKDIISAIVENDGMNYGGLPKGLLTFHRYADGSTRTPVEEQMVEGATTAATNGKVKLHFTVSENHRELFSKKIEAVRPILENKFGVKYDISMSVQKPSTDTVAVTPDNQLFRDNDGNIVFRPGGHGALIENLSDIDSTVVFIKNIDNVVPDSRRESTIRYKKVLAGVLIEAHDTIEKYIDILKAGTPSRAMLNEMVDFLKSTLATTDEHIADMSDAELARYLLGKFNRPIRVCGMVVNEGEPGGGPYIVYNADGSASPQILESTQIDTANPEATSMMKTATHFNPVDLVCYIKDVDGNKFDLKKFVDPETGFISEKSLGGRDLRALELPGLWNGAMSDWSTIFVEVPASTFNPVKTVNDLLRPVHQAQND